MISRYDDRGRASAIQAKGEGKVHIDRKYEYKNLEVAREAAEVACHAAAKLKPSRIKTADDDDWRVHPDRSDQTQSLRPIVTLIEAEVT